MTGRLRVVLALGLAGCADETGLPPERIPACTADGAVDAVLMQRPVDDCGRFPIPEDPGYEVVMACVRDHLASSTGFRVRVDELENHRVWFGFEDGGYQTYEVYSFEPSPRSVYREQSQTVRCARIEERCTIAAGDVCLDCVQGDLIDDCLEPLDE